MPDLSVAIVCCNNAATIGRTLESVRGMAREIVAVDGGSTDGTLDLLAQHNARIVSSPWLGHVRTKQLALDHCAGPWVLCLDSDESAEPELRRSIERVLASEIAADVAGFEINRKVFYAGAFLHHAWQPEWRLRLVRRGRARWGGVDPHDGLRVEGGPGPSRVIRLDGDLRHDSIDSISEFLGKQVQYGRISAAGLHAMGVRSGPARLLISPAGAFVKQLVLKRAFLDGWRGWLAAASAATAALAKHAALIELQRRAPDHRRDADR